MWGYVHFVLNCLKRNDCPGMHTYMRICDNCLNCLVHPHMPDMHSIYAFIHKCPFCVNGNKCRIYGDIYNFISNCLKDKDRPGWYTYVRFVQIVWNQQISPICNDCPCMPIYYRNAWIVWSARFIWIYDEMYRDITFVWFVMIVRFIHIDSHMWILYEYARFVRIV